MELRVVELKGFGVEPRGYRCGTEGCAELSDFWCGTERFWGLKRSVPFVWIRCVELGGV